MTLHYICFVSISVVEGTYWSVIVCNKDQLNHPACVQFMGENQQRLLKFYYKLCYGTLPHYFNHYREIIERQPVRPLRQHLIHPPFLRTVYAECTPLYQLIKLINILKTDKSDTILEKLATQNCSYSGFSYHIVNRYLNAYDPICKLKHCFVCIRI